MVLRLDPRLPVLWRSPDSLQVGADPAVATLETVTTADERIIAGLRVGMPRSALDYIAGVANSPTGRLDALLETLAPAIVTGDGPVAPRTRGTVCLDGEGETAQRIRDLLDEIGVAVTASQRPDAAVLVATHVIEPNRYGHWLRRDVPHLPVVFGDSSASVGPFVVPGRTACLFCHELERVDADAAWPALAAQLVGRPAASETPLAAAIAVSVVAATLAGFFAASAPFAESNGEVVTIDPLTGSTRVSRAAPHPRCGCAALPENVTAHGGRAVRSRRRPNSGRASSAPA
jgi:bacteriocin biosynthesis cyclodehydratase domain-containing protein